MHCPQCGQQASGGERFCRHCGFSLQEVKSLLAPAQQESTDSSSSGWLDLRVGADPRSRKGLNQAAALLILPLIAIFALMIQGVFNFALLPFLILAKIFFILLLPPILRFGYAVFEAKQELHSKSKNKISATQRLEPSPVQSLPASSFGSRPRETAEVVQPPSVTDHTTKLLSETKD